MSKKYLALFLITFIFLVLFLSETLAFAFSTPHGGYTLTTDWCAVCHRGHTGVQKALRSRTPEENLCYICHDGTGSIYNMQAQFAKTYKHLIVDYVGRHTAGTSDDLSSANRHAECEDCHDPHQATSPDHTAPGNTASNVLKGVWGVEPASWPTPSLDPAAPATPYAGVSLVRVGNDYLYALRGSSNVFWQYNKTTKLWTAMATTPATVDSGGALVWTGGDFIYALRGNSTGNFWRYKISTNQWNDVDPADPSATVSSGGALVWTGGDFIYAFQGNATTTFGRYQISTNQWSAMTTTPATVSSGGALVWTGGDFIYAFRGSNTRTFWRYKISTGQWNDVDPTDLPASATAVYPGGSLTYDGTYIYALPGNSSTQFWRYDIGSNAWSQLSSTPDTIGTNNGNRLAYDDTYVWALRGNDDASFWRYNITNNKWRDYTVAPSSYNVVNPIQKEYQLCLKCHSNYVSLPSGSVNIAGLINPNNKSYHPIVSAGNNPYTYGTQMRVPWNGPSGTHYTMYCSDCHGSNVNDTPAETTNPTDPLGPHGSNLDKILRVTIVSDSTNGTPLCNLCHNPAVYWSGTSGATGFDEHPGGKDKHKTQYGCLLCHIGGDAAGNEDRRVSIHGSNEYRVGDSTYKGLATMFLTGDGVKYVDTATNRCWTEGVCGNEHSDKTYSAR